MGAMPTRSISDLPMEQTREPQLATLGWALRRAALGLLILFTVAGLGAWLFHASIEPDASSTAHSEYALPPN
jgi:hypothetical protein